MEERGRRDEYMAGWVRGRREGGWRERSEEELTGGGIQGLKGVEGGMMERRGRKSRGKINGGRMGWKDEECKGGGINWRRMVRVGWVLIVTEVFKRCLVQTLLIAYCCL